jgi:hypothetical protein
MAHARTVLVVGGFILFLGCTDSRRIEAPSLDPEAAATRAMDDYDKNKDGFLDAQELVSCPSLKSALKRLDKNGDGRLSQDEIIAKLKEFQASRVGLYVTTAKVQMDGKPLANATVEMEPEPFMGPSAKAAQGTTDENGRTTPRTSGADLPGCQFGFYRVRISKKDGAGKELIPARYQISLGADVPSFNAIVFKLSSK